MPGIQTFKCPNCGSPVTTTGAEKEVQCAYCGSTVIVPEELRDAPPPQPMEINFGQTRQPSNDQVFQTMETAGKVAAGVTVGVTAMSFILPVILTCVILAAVGGILYYVFSNVNSALQQSNQITSTSAAPNNQIATLVTTDTVVPTEAIPTPVSFSKVLFKDNFTDPSSGWSRAKNQNYTLEYEKGFYHILINPSSNGGQAVWISDSYSNMSVEADVQQTSGSGDGTVGVACRAINNGGMYAFEFDQNGDYGIYEYDASGNSNSLTEGTLNPNTVGQGDVNHLEGVCDGDTLTLLLNNQVLAQVQDSTYTKGGMGMIVNPGSGGDGSIDVLFSNFLVKGP